MEKTIVIARYKEDIGWLDELKDIKQFVVQKGEHLDNYGRESLSYLWYIIENYDKLKGLYFFVQGEPFTHCPMITKIIKSREEETFMPLTGLGGRLQGIRRCNLDGTPHHPNGLPIVEILKETNLNYDKDFIDFYAGGQFSISSNEIKKYPREFYQKLYNIHYKFPDSPWVFERIWHIIFKK